MQPIRGVCVADPSVVELNFGIQRGRYLTHPKDDNFLREDSVDNRQALFRRGDVCNRNAKVTVYRYNGDAKSVESEFDAAGDIPRYEVGEVIQRNGKPWRVARINEQTTFVGPEMLPVEQLFLVEFP